MQFQSGITKLQGATRSEIFMMFSFESSLFWLQARIPLLFLSKQTDSWAYLFLD